MAFCRNGILGTGLVKEDTGGWNPPPPRFVDTVEGEQNVDFLSTFRKVKHHKKTCGFARVP